MRAVLALAVVGLAVVGAVLHPLALLLELMPFDPRGLVLFLTEAKSLIADVLGWGVLALLAVMLLMVVKARLAPGSSNTTHRPTGALHSTKMAVGIVAYNEADAIADLV